MGRYSAPDPITGALVEIKFKKLSELNNVYLVYLGPNKIGQVHNLGYSGWHAVNYARPELNRFGQGFKTRWKATEFLLRTCGSWTEIHH